MAVPAGFDTVEQGFDIKSLNKYSHILNIEPLKNGHRIDCIIWRKRRRDLDFFNLLTYDYHTAEEAQVNHHAPLRALSDEGSFSANENLNIVSCTPRFP